jgi:hypothetical protein
MRRLVPLLALPLLATACASVPMASPELDRAAKEFRTTPGRSNLYLFRDESIGGAVKMTVLLDGQLFGDTAAKTFLVATIAPGKHVLMSKTENDAQLDFTAEAGKNVYVWQEVKMGVWAARSALHLVDEAAARPRVAECSMAVRSDQAPAPAAAEAQPPPTSAPKEPAAVPRS